MRFLRKTNPNTDKELYITVPIITKTITARAIINQLFFLFVGINNPPNIRITNIIESAMPNLGNISEKNIETILNCKDMNATANAMITLIPLPELGLSFDEKIFNFESNPKTKAYIKRNGKAYWKIPAASHCANKSPRAPPRKNQKKLK